MNSLDALRTMVDHYPGGRPVIAARLGISEEVLRKQLSGAATHKHGVVDALRISDMCIEAKSEHCYAFINAVTGRSGGFIQLPVVDMPPLPNLQRSMQDVIREMSDVSITTIDTDSDDVISTNDLERNLKEINEARAALANHERNVRAKHAAGQRLRAA